MKEQLLEGTQQRIGRRLALTPYYQLTNQASGQLQLESRPEANRAVGLQVIGLGIGLILIALLIAISGLLSLSGGAGFAVGAFAAVIGGLLGGLGYQRIVGGYAILTMQNQVTYDPETAVLSLRQWSKVGSVRIQRLHRAQIRSLRLRRRPLVVGWPIRRTAAIVALELVVGEAAIWVIDTATNPAAILPTAEALSEALGLEFSTG
ncbi:MAG: hypothetical protein AB4911_17725 [Oscillochloridaceae bacterium umkhey_bin13]